ncbi:MAG: aldehyde dehydrogenase family protein, partial [Nitrospirota bacterium]|nr:aldehyde dehydrogenase family protein [Nitrospirota bacterium]
MTVATAKPILVGGQWVQASSVEPVRNPYSNDVLAMVCQAEPEHIHQVTEAAKRVSTECATIPAHIRAKALHHIASGLSTRREEFASTICQEAGKPITDARREVDRAIQTFRLAAEESTRIPGEILPMDLTPGGEAYSGSVKRFPIGTVL